MRDESRDARGVIGRRDLDDLHAGNGKLKADAPDESKKFARSETARLGSACAGCKRRAHGVNVD